VQIHLQPCGRFNFQMYHLAPVEPNGWTLVGERDKWVPVRPAAAAAAAVRAGGGAD
jgi:hypothetical protein